MMNWWVPHAKSPLTITKLVPSISLFWKPYVSPSLNYNSLFSFSPIIPFYLIIETYFIYYFYIFFLLQTYTKPLYYLNNIRLMISKILLQYTPLFNKGDYYRCNKKSCTI